MCMCMCACACTAGVSPYEKAEVEKRAQAIEQAKQANSNNGSQGHVQVWGEMKSDGSKLAKHDVDSHFTKFQF